MTDPTLTTLLLLLLVVLAIKRKRQQRPVLFVAAPDVLSKKEPGVRGAGLSKLDLGSNPDFRSA